MKPIGCTGVRVFDGTPTGMVYRRHSHDTLPLGDLSAEVFYLNGAGKIVRSVSHYG